MSFKPYLALLRTRGVARLLGFAVLAKLPGTTVGVVLTLYVTQQLDRSYREAGFVVMAMTVGMFIGGPWRGRVVDTKGLRRAVLPSVIVEACAWAVAPFLPYEALVGLAVVVGLFMTPIYSIVRQALAVMVKPEDQQTALSLDAVITELIFAVGPLGGTLLATMLHERWALMILGLLTVAGAAVMMWFNPPIRSTQLEGHTLDRSDEGARGALATAATPKIAVSAGLIAVLGACFAVSFVLTGTDLSLVGTIKEDWGLAGTMVGVTMAFWCLGSALGGLLYGALRRPIHPLLIVLALAVCTLPAAIAPNVFWLSAALLLAGFTCAPSMTAINHTLLTMVPEHRRGEVMGWNASSSTAGSALGAPVIGQVIDAGGGRAGFAGAAAVGIVLAVLGIGIMGVRRVTSRRASEGSLAPSAEVATPDDLEGTARKPVPECDPGVEA